MLYNSYGTYPINIKGYAVHDLVRMLIYWKFPDQGLKQKICILLIKRSRQVRLSDESGYEYTCWQIEFVKWQELEYYRQPKRMYPTIDSKLEVINDNLDEIMNGQQIIIDKMNDLHAIIEENQRFNQQHSTRLLLILLLFLLGLWFYFFL